MTYYRDILHVPGSHEPDPDSPLADIEEVRNNEAVRMEQLADLIISFYLEWKQLSLTSEFQTPDKSNKEPPL